MTKANYAAMTDHELKQYMLAHRDDQEAFHSYMDRRHLRPGYPAISPDDPAWEEKIVAVIQAQINGDR